MKKVFEKILKELILTKEEKQLVRMIFQELDKNMLSGHDDFFNWECINIEKYNKIKKKFGINPRKE